MGDILRHSDPGRALAIYDHTLKDMEAVKSEFLQRRAVHVLAGSSFALRRLGRATEARQRLDRALAVLDNLGLYSAGEIQSGSEVQKVLIAQAAHEADTGHVARALDLYQRVSDALTARGRPTRSFASAVDLSTLYQSMAALQRRSGRAHLASALEERRLELWRHWNRTLPDNPFVLRQLAVNSR